MDILCGIEWDLLSEDKRTGYDYWIGSAHHLYGKNTGKYYEIDFRPQDLHAASTTLRRDPLAAVEAILRRGGEGGGHGPRHPRPHRPYQELNAAGEFFDEESPPL